jgi:hypothetical protein
MATRFYFLEDGVAPPITPGFDGGWEQTGSAARRHLYPKFQVPIVDTLADRTVTVPITTTQQILNVQFIGPPMPACRIVGTFSMVVRGQEGANGANAHFAHVLRVLSQDGGTVRGTLSSRMTTSTEYTTAGQTRIFGPTAVTPLTTMPGDRLVLELGAHAQAPTAASSATLRFGNSAATDFALTSGLTTDLKPWCEFSDNLFGPFPNNWAIGSSERNY